MYYYDLVLWPNNTIKYRPVTGPNSNTFAHWLGVRAAIYDFPAPPGAYGWNYPLIFLP
jgi:hypothetical protein